MLLMFSFVVQLHESHFVSYVIGILYMSLHKIIPLSMITLTDIIVATKSR